MAGKRRQDRDGLYQRPGSPFWWASFTDRSGERFRRSTKCRSKDEAQQVLSRWRLEAGQQPAPGQGGGITFDELMVLYLREVSEQKKDPVRDWNSLAHLKPAFSGKLVQEISRADVNAYIQNRKAAEAAASTINSEVGLFSAACNYAQLNWEWEIPNPAEGLKQQEPEGRVRYLLRKEAARLLWQARRNRGKAPHLQDFLLLALHTGMRKRELTKLTWDRVDMDLGLIFLAAEHSKGIKRRSVPINPKARLALLRRIQFNHRYCPDSPYVFARRNGDRMDDPKKSFATARDNAGIKDFRIHDLRHTFASWLVMSGVSLYEVRDLLGHTTVEMTERYAHLAPENLRSAVDRISAKPLANAGSEQTAVQRLAGRHRR